MLIVKRFIIPAAAVLACLWCLWTSASTGAARLVSDYGARARLLPSADLAARLSPADPESHYARAALLADRGEFADAAGAYERAIALRPGDYVLWLELGRAREQLGDAVGAVAAFNESARLAPAYAQPRWQLGNALLRAGRAAEALAELGRASASDPQLYPNFVELAWHAAGGDARRLEEIVRPGDARQSLLLARFLAGHGKAHEAVRLFRAAEGGAGDEVRRALVRELLAADDFAGAHEVWAAGGDAPGGTAAPPEGAGGGLRGMTDGGFEGSIRLDDAGFGWRLAGGGVPNVEPSLDSSAARGGSQSLRLDYRGDSPPPAEVVSQLVLVEPGATYRLGFAARTEELVTGGLPFVGVTEVRPGEAAAPLAESQTLSAGTSSGWRDYSVEFTTSRQALGARVSVQRRSCPGAPCPVFGRAWLDDFSLTKTKGTAGTRR